MKPTYEDIVKYASQKTNLLLKVDCYALPFEARILQVLNDGEMFKFGLDSYGIFGGSGQWVMTRDVEVLHIFPPMELTRRLAELEKPVTTVKDVKQVFQKADEVNAISSEALMKIWNDMRFPKPILAKDTKKKKPRKKK